DFARAASPPSQSEVLATTNVVESQGRTQAEQKREENADAEKRVSERADAQRARGEKAKGREPSSPHSPSRTWRHVSGVAGRMVAVLLTYYLLYFGFVLIIHSSPPAVIPDWALMPDSWVFGEKAVLSLSVAGPLFAAVTF